MVEYDRHSQRENADQPALRTCIIGIGGAGSNVLDRITLDRTVDAQLISMHTDIRVLSHAMTTHKVQLGAELMRGIGAGGDPDLGREAALFSRDEIRQSLEGHDIIFICAGLGGGTGSGAAPVIAEIAKGTNALVFVTATMPFSFEGRRRLGQAEEALKQLQKRADALVLFENNRMGELILPKDGIQKAFVQADQLIAQSLRAVSTIVTTPGIVKLGLDDLTAALSTSNGRCLFGFGEARGANRGAEALKRALKSPLIDQGRLLHQTKTLLVHIAGGESLTLMEVDAVMKQLGRHVPDQTHILFGVAVDTKLGDSIAVTLISSLGLEQLNTLAAAAPPADMLPLSTRTMPSVVSAVAAQTQEPPPAPVEPAAAPMAPIAEEPPAPPAPAAELEEAPAAPPPAPEPEPEPSAPSAAASTPPETPEPTPEPPPAPAPAPAPSLVMVPTTLDLPFDTEDTAPAQSEVPQEKAPEPEMFSTHTTAAEALARFVTEPETLVTPAPALEPKPKERLRIEDFLQPSPAERPTTTLADVVARATPPPPAVESTYAPPAAAEAPALTKKIGGTEQIDFRFGEEDRGRFKDTQPAIASGGEDLDVPTWMRLKRKLKR